MVPFRRRQFLVTIVPGASAFLAGCVEFKHLDTSAAGEGTGIQIIGAIIVLARYRASAQQRTVAEERGQRAFVDRAMKPALAAAKKKAQARHAQKIAAISHRTGMDPAAREKAIASLQQEAQRELTSLDTSWHEAATSYTRGRYSGDFVVAGGHGTVAMASLKESDVLGASAAYVSQNLAVPVPAEKAIAGARETVMFWDTRGRRLAKDEAYALDREPEAGKVSTFGDVKAEFVAR